jgi:flagellar motor switch/type III secretory pathway protein FliN
MSSDDRASEVTTVEVLEDAPVVVRVELGTVEMTARDWAALGTGDVVAIGRKIGDGAVLRVGGVEIARGELVMLEGEIAVRITGRGARSGGGNG